MPRMDAGTENTWSVFAATARRFADREAFLCGDQSMSFAQLYRRAEDFRAWFRQFGLTPGDRVLVSVEASAHMASAIAGIWGAGGIPILMDSGERGPFLDHAIRTAEPALAICPSETALPISSSELEQVSIDDVERTTPALGDEVPAGGSSPASILFTSGSTGKPKGVTQTHGSLIRGCRTVAGYLGLDGSDRIVCGIPWSFDYGYGQLLTTLLMGTTQVLPTGPGLVPLCQAIALHRPTVLPGIPSLFTYLLRGPAPFRDTDLSPLRIVTNTGGTIPEPVLSEMFEVFAHCQIFLNYGLTESYRTSYLEPSLVRERPTSIGKPIPGVDVVVVTEKEALAEPGEVGEIVHRGDFLFSRYWNDPEATARALRPDPVTGGSTAARVLFTGDLGSMDDQGFLYFHGRRDHQIKSMGVRVNPSAVEELLRTSGLVEEAAVFGRPNDLIGQEVWAAVIPRRDDPTLVRRLSDHAHRVMSRYMKPRHYLVMDALPRTRTGKIDYPALAEEADRSRTASL